MNKQNYQDRQNYLKQRKIDVEEIELNARYNKANYDIMNYTVLAETLKDSYFTIVEKQKEDFSKQQEDFKQMLEQSKTETNVGQE